MGTITDAIAFSDWIQILSIIATTIISIVSVIIATKSLRLTKKSIEDANRPYIGCFVEMIEVGHFQKYFVIKNFGKTPATIVDIKFNKEIKGLGREGKLDSVKNALIAPNQKFITAVNVKEIEDLIVTIVYEDMKNQTTEQAFNLNLGFTSDLLYKTSDDSRLTNDMNALRNVLHQLTKRGI